LRIYRLKHFAVQYGDYGATLFKLNKEALNRVGLPSSGFGDLSDGDALWPAEQGVR
jgi:hypothetical protein